jgi:hypothetical protein
MRLINNVLDKNRTIVFTIKFISIFSRALLIFYFIFYEKFSQLGDFTLLSTLSVVFSGLIGLEMHMVVNRNIVSKKTQHSPLISYWSLILIVGGIINVLLFLFVTKKASIFGMLVILFYVIGEYVRYHNFSNRIVKSSLINLLRDFIIITSFLLYLYDVNWGLILSTFFYAVLLRLTLIKKIEFSDTFRIVNKYFKDARLFYLDIISRNIITYADRFIVLFSVSLVGLGKYSLGSFISLTLSTLITGTVVYTRLPQLLNKELNREQFIKATIPKSFFLYTIGYIVGYFIILNFEIFKSIYIEKQMIAIFFIQGLSLILLSTSGQILYCFKRDGILVLTSIVSSILTLLIPVFYSDFKIFLLINSIIVIIISIYRLKVIKQ